MDEDVARDKAEKFFTLFDLKDFTDELIEGYSHGMRQKLVIAGALIHDPKVVIVDEPLVGLDPKGAPGETIVSGFMRKRHDDFHVHSFFGGGRDHVP